MQESHKNAGLSIFIMVTNIEGAYGSVNAKGKEPKPGRMEIFMRVGGLMIRCTYKGNTHPRMAWRATKEVGAITNEVRDGELRFTEMVPSASGSGIITC